MAAPPACPRRWRGNALRLENGVHGLFNLSAENYRIRDIAKEIQKIVPNVKVDYQDLKFEDLRNYRVSAEAIRKIGWEPKYDMSQGIREMYAVIRENRIKDLNNPIYYNAHYINERHSKL